MAKPIKTLDNTTKHWTKDEIEARAAMEGSMLPARKMKKPKLITADNAACKHWNRILKDMAGLEILDILDTDALGIYCAKLARRDDLQAKYLEIRTVYALTQDNGTMRNMINLSSELQSVERDLLSYAGKLGLTPESRVRLARRAAEVETDDPDDDLFA